jgi:hypothetical protein
MAVPSIFFTIKMSRKKKQVARVRDLAVTEVTFRISPASPDEPLIRIRAPRELPQLPPTQFYSVKDAHSEFGLSEKRIRSLYHRKKIGGMKMPNGRLLVNRSSLREYVEGEPPRRRRKRKR